jgi:formylglycine-generating enzyme required for sulfatase activity
MKCQQCQQDWAENFKFCPECGVPIAAVEAGDRNTAAAGEDVSPEPVRSEAVTETKAGSARQRYLRWMARTCGRLVLSGIQSGQQPYVRLNLDDVYVPLEAVEILPVQEQQEMQADKAMPNLPEREKPAARPINLKDLLAVGPRIVVIGGPGSGKSTVLQHIAWTLAQALVGNQPELARGRLGLAGPLPLPILVPLHTFAAHRTRCRQAADPELSTLAACVHDYLTREKTLDLSVGFFKSLLEGGNCLVMLDGLDEVGSESERELVCRAVESLADWLPDNGYIVTSRPAAYRDQSVIAADFRQVQVKPLEHDDIVRLVTRLYRAAGYAERTERLLRWLDDLEAHYTRQQGDEERRLIDSPLMVRLVAIVDLSGEKLPEQRAALYDRFADALLHVTYHPEATVRQALERLGGPAEDQLQWLAILAYAMHGRKAGTRSLTERRVRALLQQHLAPTLGEEAAAKAVRQFIAATRSRAGLVEVRSGRPDRWSFTHHPFQEFLAAVYLADIVDDVGAMAAELEKEGRVAQAWWQEVVLLLLGYLSFRNPYKAHGLARRLARLPGPPAADWLPLDPAARQSGAPLAAAERVAVSLLERPGALPRLEGEVAERLAVLFRDTDLMNAAPPALRAQAGNALARLGDRRPGVGTRSDGTPDIVWCKVPSGSFPMGDDKIETPMLYSYSISKHAITNAQFGAFVEAGGYAVQDYWTPAGWDWRQKQGLAGPRTFGREFDLPNHPVVGASWYEAVAFCRWLSAITEQEIRLPTEAEWEKAARGTGGWKYPWGDEFDAALCNVDGTGLSGTSTVGIFPGGASPCGALDMAGNVWEWCQSLYASYPYQADDGREDLEASGSRVLRGGAWHDVRSGARCAYRFDFDPRFRYFGVGMRVVLSPALHS